MIYISLIEAENMNFASEHETFMDAIKAANYFVNTENNFGKVHSINIFETQTVVMGAERIKEQCKLTASVRTIR
jgi:hypothetical protein